MDMAIGQMNHKIKSIELEGVVTGQQGNQRIVFSPDTNALSGDNGSGKTTIFKAIHRALLNDSLSLDVEGDVGVLKKVSDLFFFDEMTFEYSRPPLVKKLIDQYGVSSADLQRLSERFCYYVNCFVKRKIQYSYNNYYLYKAEDDRDAFDCVLSISGDLKIIHKDDGRLLDGYFMAAGERTCVAFALKLALLDLLDHRVPLIIDDCLRCLDESLLPAVWLHLITRDNQLIVFESPMLWKRLGFNPTHNINGLNFSSKT